MGTARFLSLPDPLTGRHVLGSAGIAPTQFALSRGDLSPSVSVSVIAVSQESLYNGFEEPSVP